MTHDHTASPASAGRGLASRCYEAITALSMTVGRGAAARPIAERPACWPLVAGSASPSGSPSPAPAATRPTV